MITKTGDISLSEDGITCVRIFADVKQGLPEAKENLAAAIEVGLRQRRPLLTDIRYCQPLTPEARRYYSGQVLVDCFSALALLIDISPFGRTMGNIYLQIARPGIPTQLFTDENLAINWLKSFT